MTEITELILCTVAGSLSGGVAEEEEFNFNGGKAFSKRIYLHVVHHIECRVAIFQRQIEPYFTSPFFQLFSPLLVTAGEELFAPENHPYTGTFPRD